MRIVSGSGVLSQLPAFIPAGKVLLVTTEGTTRRGLTARVKSLFGEERVLVHDRIKPNPELDTLDEATANLKGKDVRSIVALGGGSALDAGKVLSVTLPVDASRPLDHALRQGLSHSWEENLPVIAIPTTAGTGAEVTPFATVWDTLSLKKHSVAGNLVYPCYAILDPDLTLTLPYQETLYTALDTISHALESLWNRNCTTVSEPLAMQALKLAVESLPLILEDPSDLRHRAKMQHASMMAGMAISQTHTAIAHAISYPLTMKYGIPHGLACSFTLVEIWKYCHNDKKEVLNSLIVKKTIEMMGKIDLLVYIQKYTKEANISDLIEDMFHPERANNFISFIDESVVYKVLLESIAKRH